MRQLAFPSTIHFFQWLFLHQLFHVRAQMTIPEIFVYENITIGSVVLQDIRAHLSLPAQSVVKLGPGSLGQFFRLDSDTGELRNSASLDLESSTLCKVEKSCCRLEQTELASFSTSNHFKSNRLSYTDGVFEGGHRCRLMTFILAKSMINTQLSPAAKLYISVMDINDNKPVFPISDPQVPSATNIPSNVRLRFVEGSDGVGSKEDLVLAYDADFSPDNRVKRYWLEWATLPGAISTFGPKISMQKSEILTVDGPSVERWVVLGPFRLVQSAVGKMLALELESELDKEQQSQYDLHLIAEDGGGQQGILPIVVEVIDVNEFDPVFIDEPLNLGIPPQDSGKGTYVKRYQVKESLPVGSEIGRLYAIDADQSYDSHIIFRMGMSNLRGDSQVFSVNPKTGSIVLVKPLDFETTQLYRLPVIAQDGVSYTVDNELKVRPGTTSRSTTGILEITVTDVNDNAPVIRFENGNNLETPTALVPGKRSEQNVHEVHIKEDISPGHAVTFFSVHDHDLNENGQVTCDLVNWTDRFRLREFAGLFTVETASDFDRETQDIYHVSIRCQDHGDPPLQTDQILAVHIEDVNDLPPKFPLNLYRFTVFENSPPRTLLEPMNSNFPPKVTATDPDRNDTVKYKLEPIDLNHLPGELRKIVSSNSFATDHHLFYIDPESGDLYTRGELDRESREMHAFNVCANDGIHSACTSVVVSLHDVNDNRPVFERDTYVVRVEENQLPTKPLIIFRVNDADADNRGFHFDLDVETENEIVNDPQKSENGSKSRNFRTIPGTVHYHFALRENILYLRRPLDRELRSSYHFYIRATDLHDYSAINEARLPHSTARNLTSRVEVFIDVTDVNDNVPWLVFPNSTGPFGNHLIVSCRENMGSSVGRLQATDVDMGQNSTLLFSLIQTPEVDQLFQLYSHSGELFVNTGELSTRCGQTSLLIVTVDDQGPPDSKRSRNLPVERLIIKLEDKPTLAQLIEIEARQRLHHTASDVHTDGVNSNSTYMYGHISTRTVLSVVLGGSTIFLMCLLIVWIVLLVFNRSRRRKNGVYRTRNDNKSDGGFSTGPMKRSDNSGQVFCEAQLTENQVKQGDGNMYFDRVAWETLDRNELDEGYGVLHPTLRHACASQVSKNLSPQMRGHELWDSSLRTRRVSLNEKPDYATVCRHKGAYEKVSFPDRKLYKSATWSKATFNQNLDVEVLPENCQSSSTFGRLLPKWIKNNIGLKTTKPSSLKPQENTANKRRSVCYLIPEANAMELRRSPRQREQHSQASSGNYTEMPFQNQVAYATLRTRTSPMVKVVSAPMNNQDGKRNDAQLNISSFLPCSSVSNQADTCANHREGEYTPLVRASTPTQSAQCKSTLTPNKCSRSGTPAQSSSAQQQSGVVYLVRDSSIPPSMCSGEMLYPCCCATCDLSHQHVWSQCDRSSLEHSATDSTQTCLQCHSLDAAVSQACCNNCVHLAVFNADRRTTACSDQICNGTMDSAKDIYNACV